MNVVVEVARYRNTRRAVHLKLLYGPFDMDVPGTSVENVLGMAIGMASASLGSDGFEVIGAEPLEEETA